MSVYLMEDITEARCPRCSAVLRWADIPGKPWAARAFCLACGFRYENGMGIYPPFDIAPRPPAEENDEAVDRQPAPEGDGEIVLARVIEDLKARSRFGEKKYGTKLRANNGRDALLDAYQEALDLVMYLRQELMEREKR